MTEAERAEQLADEIEYHLVDRQTMTHGESAARLIVRALRAYSTTLSTDADLREGGGKAIYEAPGRWKEWEGLDDAMKEAFRCQFDATLSAIYASGWRVVPYEPTDAMMKAGVEYRLRTTIGGDNNWYEDTKRLYGVMRDAGK